MPADVPDLMRAWVVTAYGGPEVLALHDVPVPRPGPRDVLIRVMATTVSSGDRRIRAFDLPAGMGMIGRIVLGFRRPRRAILGAELVGTVAAVGRDVSLFAPGDSVIAFPGIALGAHAEYCRIREDRMIVPRPPGLSLESAAALGFGGTTARHFLRRAQLKPGESVLVIGASGTVGSALVQLAAHSGARVTAMTSSANRDLALDLGAAEALDYASHDLEKSATRYDIVADAVGALTFRRALPILAEGGRFLSIAGGLGDLLARRRGSRRPIAGPAAERVEDLAALVALVASGAFRPLIDSVMPFQDLPRAHARADTGRKRGSVVITVP